MTTDGDTNQQMLGQRFGTIRADILGLTQRELAAELTAFGDELISPTRISDSERGKANFCTDYAQLFLSWLRGRDQETADTLSVDDEFQDMLAKLPAHGMVHRENESPGNHYDGPRAAPIAKVNRKRAVAQSPVVMEQEILRLVYRDDKVCILLAGGYSITVERDDS